MTTVWVMISSDSARISETPFGDQLNIPPGVGVDRARLHAWDVPPVPLEIIESGDKACRIDDLVSQRKFS